VNDVKVVNANLQYSEKLIPLILDKVRYIILHHPAAKVYTPEQCHKDHLANGWAGAGYNEYIRKDGTVYIMRGDHIGAQCHGMNSVSYGICCEGNYQVEKEMPEAQFNALVKRIQYHAMRFPNFLEVAPHSKFSKTACPGIYFPVDQAIDAFYGVEPAAQDLYSAIEFWTKKACVLNSPTYWLENAVIGGTVNGENAAALLIKTANYARKKGL
jgi:N-acetylmuramoyl-L-alanine amidase